MSTGTHISGQTRVKQMIITIITMRITMKIFQGLLFLSLYNVVAVLELFTPKVEGVVSLGYVPKY